jgi:ribokinase
MQWRHLFETLGTLDGIPHDLIAIGDVTTDAFIRLKDAHVTCQVNNTACQICMKFGDKVPFEAAYIVPGVGNAANAAVAAARLGLSTALVSDIGDDEQGSLIKECLQKEDVDVRLVTSHAGSASNYHYVLWYGDERTILVKHETYAYALPRCLTTCAPERAPQWVYITSLGNDSEQYHKQIIEWLNKNPQVRVAFQPGTFQMKLGVVALDGLYRRTEVFIVNTEEAQRILGIAETGTTMHADPSVKKLAAGLHALGPKIVCITDGSKGAYMSLNEGKDVWYMPLYPDIAPPKERTGCGDAFAATFVTALAKGMSPEAALLWAPINPMMVVQYVGAQQGLLTEEALTDLLAKAPKEYRPQKI